MLQRIRALLNYKGYKVFTRPYELNIVGLRGENVLPNRFDDGLHVFFKTSPLHWEYHVFRITTDPGTFWLENPSQPQGTAILAEGQYNNAYAIGLHHGKYKALVQVKPVTVMRDYDRKAVLDFYNGKNKQACLASTYTEPMLQERQRPLINIRQDARSSPTRMILQPF